MLKLETFLCRRSVGLKPRILPSSGSLGLKPSILLSVEAWGFSPTKNRSSLPRALALGILMHEL
jgi:hypothetical protein